MTNIYSFISRYLPGFRNSLLIILLCFSGNHHQALVKHENDIYLSTDYDLLLKEPVSFNSEYIDYLTGELDALLARRKFNGSILVAHEGKAAFNKAMGFANLSGSKQLGESGNVFQLASVGKQFTAMAILILQERGLLDFDDPVTEHISEFPYPDITIRHMLNHTSGLQNYMYLIDSYWKEDRLPGHDDLLNLFVNRKLPLNFTPGRRFNYSNTGYAFLALVVQQVSGMSFADFAKQEIFDPLGMNRSFVFVPEGFIPEEIADNLVAGHERLGRSMRVIPFDYLDGITGDKGIFSCNEDLLKWDNALNDHKLVSEETLNKAFERGRLRSGYAINYGFGFRIRREAQNDIAYHNGWWRGFRTSYVRLPDNTLIVVLNNTNASINGLDRQIRNIIEKSPYQKFPETDSSSLIAAAQ
jgi:CubicO group peptidase (beta-lactamase class C family)